MNQSERENFAYNLWLLRMVSKITAQDLSFELGLNDNRISAIEGNPRVRPTDEEVAIISAYFGYTVEIMTTKKATIVLQ